MLLSVSLKVPLPEPFRTAFTGVFGKTSLGDLRFLRLTIKKIDIQPNTPTNAATATIFEKDSPAEFVEGADVKVIVLFQR